MLPRVWVYPIGKCRYGTLALSALLGWLGHKPWVVVLFMHVQKVVETLGTQSDWIK